jgi:hypothetical protein
MNFLKLSSILAFVVLVDCRPPLVMDIGIACMVQDLQQKGKLEADFPFPSTDNTDHCDMVMGTLLEKKIKTFQDKMLSEPSIKTDCVMNEIKNVGFFDNIVLRDLITVTVSLFEEVQTRKLNDVEESLKRTFEDAAKKCDSNPTYAGLFNEILRIKNESIAVLTENYCLAKFVKDNKMLDVNNFETNPNNIDTENIDCDNIFAAKITAYENSVREDFKKDGIVDVRILDCAIGKYRAAKVLENAVASDVLEQIDISIEDKRRNKQKILESLELLSVAEARQCLAQKLLSR